MPQDDYDHLRASSDADIYDAYNRERVRRASVTHDGSPLPTPGASVVRPERNVIEDVVRPSFLVRVGSSYRTNPNDGSDEWLAYGYMILGGWMKDPEMDENDAVYALGPLLDAAVTERSCRQAGLLCSSHAWGTAVELLDHLTSTHNFSALMLEHWLSTREKPITLRREAATDQAPLNPIL